MELGGAWHANRCGLKVLADGELKNGLTPLHHQKREKVPDSSKRNDHIRRINPRSRPRGRPLLTICVWVHECVHACACISDLFTSRQISIHFSSFIHSVLHIDSYPQPHPQTFLPAFVHRGIEGIRRKMRTGTKINYKDMNETTRLCFCHLCWDLK